MIPARQLIALVALAASTATAQIVPAPVHSQIADGASFGGNLILCQTQEFEAGAKAFAGTLQKLGAPGARSTSDLATGAPITLVRDAALGGSAYKISDTGDGRKFEKVGSAGQGTRGGDNFVTYQFSKRRVQSIKILSQGCHGLTFPSFSRPCEVVAFWD